jgi:hypothetical protein
MGKNYTRAGVVHVVQYNPVRKRYSRCTLYFLIFSAMFRKIKEEKRNENERSCLLRGADSRQVGYSERGGKKPAESIKSVKTISEVEKQPKKNEYAKKLILSHRASFS